MINSDQALKNHIEVAHNYLGQYSLYALKQIDNKDWRKMLEFYLRMNFELSDGSTWNQTKYIIAASLILDDPISYESWSVELAKQYCQPP